MAPATKYVHMRVTKRQMRQNKTISCERSLVIISGISDFFCPFSSDNSRFSFIWEYDQLGRMGKKSLQLEEGNKMSHCSQLRCTGHFLRATPSIMR